MKSVISYSHHNLMREIRKRYPEHAALAKPHLELATLSGVPLTDRTGSLINMNGVLRQSTIQWVNDIPSFIKSSRSFSEVAELRAREIWEESDRTGKKIHVMYSGGIDSVVALLALADQITSDRMSRLLVCYTDASIDEYPLLWDQMVSSLPNKKVVIANIGDSYWFDENALIVTGELGDQCFGSDLYFLFSEKPSWFPYGYDQDRSKITTNSHRKVIEHLILEQPTLKATWKLMLTLDWLKMPWQEILPFAYGIFNRFRARTSLAIPRRNLAMEQYVQPLLDRAPFKIESAAEWLWWINFTCKWQEVQTRMITYSMRRLEDLSITRHFFDSIEWQLWAMNNYHANFEFQLGRYKVPAKDYIYEHTLDTEYRDHKVKVGSLRNMRWVPDINYVYMDQYGKAVHISEGGAELSDVLIA